MLRNADTQAQDAEDARNKMNVNKTFYENYVSGGNFTLYSLILICSFVVTAKFVSE